MTSSLPDGSTLLGTDAMDLIEHDALEARGPHGRERRREEHAAAAAGQQAGLARKWKTLQRKDVRDRDKDLAVARVVDAVVTGRPE
jgi:hypothetical protein